MGGHSELAAIEDGAKQAIEAAQKNLEQNKQTRNDTQKSLRPGDPVESRAMEGRGSGVEGSDS